MTADETASCMVELASSAEAVLRIRAALLRCAVAESVTSTDKGLGGRWPEVELGSIGEWGSGGTPLRTDPSYYGGSIPWIVIGDLNNGVVSSAATSITQEGLDNSSAKLLPPGVLLIAMYGSIGKLGITGIDCATNQAIAFCKPDPQKVELRFLFHLLASLQPEFLARGQGLAQKNISQTILKAWRVKLPPLAEQKSIVAKVDELMALCDRLEAQLQERDARSAELSKAALAKFSDEPTVENLEYLFHPSFNVSAEDVRTCILMLAVQGRLVQQTPSDQPVGIALAQNDDNRRQRSLSDRRADDQSQTLLSGEDRWSIPSTWAWRGLADLVLFVDYRGKTPAKQANGVRLLTAKNVRRGAINPSPEEFISDREYGAWMTRGFPRSGDVLFTTEAPMGNAAVVKLTERFALAQRVICFQSYGAIDTAFLVLQILSEQFQLILSRNATGVTAKGIKGSKLKQLPIAVPPLEEEKADGEKKEGE